MKAEIFNYKIWIEETSPTLIKPLMGELLEKSGFNIINLTEHYFKPYGYTAVWLLEESHLAVHTFPEEQKTYVELSSCNEEKNKRFQRFFKNLKSDLSVVSNR